MARTGTKEPYGQRRQGRSKGPAGLLASILLALNSLPVLAAESAAPVSDSQKISLRWGEKIPLRDRVHLHAALYLPKQPAGPVPCIVTMTPYTAQTYHSNGVYFAARGLAFLSVDVRGRGLSEGTFRPFIQEAEDTADVVEWVAKQPYCNGTVGLWGGSYAGYLQWGAAKYRPPHLTTIIPAASPFMGIDVPGRGNIQPTTVLPAGIWISGRTMQTLILADQPFWNGVLRDRFEKGEPFATLSSSLGDPALIPQPLAQWAANPAINSFWDSYVPTDEELAAIDIPALSITGIYDSLQLGSIAFFRRNRSAATASQRRFLVVGPWDHSGTRTPRPDVGGLKVGAAGLLDLPKLNFDWYRWTMADGPRPAFLEKPVAYYVMGADRWRYADTLEEVTERVERLSLGSVDNATGIDNPGSLGGVKGNRPSDHYIYDPRDVSGAALETQVDPASLTDTRLIASRCGKQLVYERAPYSVATELSGFFKLTVWLAIDQPDTDFQVALYEVSPSGSSILLTSDQLRARYRNSVRQAELVTTRNPIRYDFDRFTFTSRQIAAGNRLRLVIGPINSIYSQKNYNSGGDVSRESMKDARPVTVSLWHDRHHPSTHHVPIGQDQNVASGEAR
jgi:putative CocE/NonD family hydrolase